MVQTAPKLIVYFIVSRIRGDVSSVQSLSDLQKSDLGTFACIHLTLQVHVNNSTNPSLTVY